MLKSHHYPLQFLIGIIFPKITKLLSASFLRYLRWFSPVYYSIFIQCSSLTICVYCRPTFCPHRGMAAGSNPLFGSVGHCGCGVECGLLFSAVGDVYSRHTLPDACSPGRVRAGLGGPASLQPAGGQDQPGLHIPGGGSGQVGILPGLPTRTPEKRLKVTHYTTRCVCVCG